MPGAHLQKRYLPRSPGSSLALTSGQRRWGSEPMTGAHLQEALPAPRQVHRSPSRQVDRGDPCVKSGREHRSARTGTGSTARWAGADRARTGRGRAGPARQTGHRRGARQRLAVRPAYGPAERRHPHPLARRVGVLPSRDRAHRGARRPGADRAGMDRAAGRRQRALAGWRRSRERPGLPRGAPDSPAPPGQPTTPADHRILSRQASPAR